MNSRDWYEIIGFHKISPFVKQPCKNVCLKNVGNALKLLKQCSTLAKQSGKPNISSFKISSHIQIFAARLPTCQHAVRLGSVRCSPSGYVQSCRIFMNLLIRWNSSTASSCFILTIIPFFFLLCSAKMAQILLNKVSIEVLISCKQLLVIYDITIKLYQHHMIKRITHAIDTCTQCLWMLL